MEYQITINVGGTMFTSTTKTMLRIGLLRGLLCPTSDSTAIAWCLGNVITPENIIKGQTIITEKELDSLLVTEDTVKNFNGMFFNMSPLVFSEILDDARCNIPVIIPFRKRSLYISNCDYWGYPWSMTGDGNFTICIDDGIKKLISKSKIEHTPTTKRVDQRYFMIEGSKKYKAL